MNPLVSILIPAFNAGEWIVETLRSAIAQTWNRKEIIVIDDGSTDNTLALAREFASSNVSVVTQSNQGAAATRNNAFKLCQGDYIQWLDADDLLSPSKVSLQMQVVSEGQSPTTLLSSAWGWFMYRASRTEFIPTDLWNDLSPTEWLICKMENNLHMQTATWLVSRELTESVGPWNPTLSVDDDGEYFCRVLLKSSKVRFVRDAKVFYRLSGVSSMSYIGRSEKKIEDQFRSMKLHIAYLRSLEDSERTRKACTKYLQTWLMYFYPERQDIVKEAERIASELGGRLEVPQLPWKYNWLKSIFGWKVAKQAQVTLPAIRWSLARSLDKAMFLLQDKKHKSF